MKRRLCTAVLLLAAASGARAVPLDFSFETMLDASPIGGGNLTVAISIPLDSEAPPHSSSNYGSLLTYRGEGTATIGGEAFVGRGYVTVSDDNPIFGSTRTLDSLGFRIFFDDATAFADPALSPYRPGHISVSFRDDTSTLFSDPSLPSEVGPENFDHLRVYLSLRGVDRDTRNASLSYDGDVAEHAFALSSHTAATVPEPSSFALLAIGAGGLLAGRRRRR